jgi:hypothetical protein
LTKLLPIKPYPPVMITFLIFFIIYKEINYIFKRNKI